MYKFFNRSQGRGKGKVFCIGSNKTGTTTLEKVLIDFGFKLGNQENAEKLIGHYVEGNWKPIIEFCKTANAFQDAPFSFPNTWIVLFEHFPEAKFVLTSRDSEEWYKSLVNHHSNSFGDGVNPPSASQLKQALYRNKYKGVIYDAMRRVWKTEDQDLYNKEELIGIFQRHNESIRHFFRDKPNFIEIDVTNDSDFKKLSEFLDIKTSNNSFPHLNKRR